MRIRESRTVLIRVAIDENRHGDSDPETKKRVLLVMTAIGERKMMGLYR